MVSIDITHGISVLMVYIMPIVSRSAVSLGCLACPRRNCMDCSCLCSRGSILRALPLLTFSILSFCGSGLVDAAVVAPVAALP